MTKAEQARIARAIHAPHLNYPKSLLGRRTPAQYEFDMAIKGWAFFASVTPEFIARAESLLPPGDKIRANTLEVIRRHVS